MHFLVEILVDCIRVQKPGSPAYQQLRRHTRNLSATGPPTLHVVELIVDRSRGPSTGSPPGA